MLLNTGAVTVLCQNRTAMAKGDFGEAFMGKHFQQAKENQCMQFIFFFFFKKSYFSSWAEQKH